MKEKIESTIKHSFMLCRNCKALPFCEKTKKQYQKYLYEISVAYEKKFEEYNQQMSGYDRLRNKDMYDQQGKLIKKKLAEQKLQEVLGDQECIYEDEIAKETIRTMNDKYDLVTNPQIYNIAEQVIKLRIQDFRIAVVHKNYGIVREQGGFLKLTPGLHYSVTISKEIGELLQKAENIVNGAKINLNVKEKWEQRLEEFKKFLQDQKENAKLGYDDN